MKPTTLLTICLLALSFSTPLQASVIDAPHNSDNNVQCGNCHTYSFWWQFSPIPPDNPSFQGVSGYNSATNAMCQACHNDPAETVAPHKKSTHSSSILGETYGNWEVACVECHDPHFQQQLEWAGTIPNDDLFLVNGTIGPLGTFVDNGNGTITFNYNLISTSPGWNTPAGTNQADIDWGRKNDNPTMDRGLILVVDNDSNSTTFANSTFKIITADSATITIKGSLSISQKTAMADTPFGLIYGQMIRSKVMAPTVTNPTIYIPKDVKFFDPQTVYSDPNKSYGGFVDQNVPRTGICQVCHIATTYWTEDGLNDASHYPDTTCSSCHERLNGFAQSTDHTLFLSKTGSSCEGCHDRSGTANVQTGIHSNCSNCHGANKTLITGANGWGDATLHGPIGLGTISDCITCHPNYAGAFQTGHQAPSHSKLTTTGCAPCHTGDHSGDLLIDIHGDGLTADCLKCHSDMTNGILLGSAANGPGNCQTCHSSMDLSDHINDHDATDFDATILNNGKSCFTCHADKINIDSGHYGNLDYSSQVIDCATCHNLTHQTVIDQGKAGTTVFCADCHTTRSADHPVTPDHKATGLVTGSSNCNSCHDPAGTKDVITDIHKGNCNNCHSTSVFKQLIGAAAGREGLTSNCQDCHTLHAADYKNHTPATHAALSVTSGCDTASCHPGPGLISDVHLDNCADCHTPLSGLLIGSASQGGTTCAGCHISRDINDHLGEHRPVNFDGNPTLTCTNCHLTMNNVSGDHLGKIIKYGEINGPISVGTVIGCPSCHASTAQAVIDTITIGSTGTAITCGACHGLRASNHPDAITPDHNTSGYLASTTDCAACHNPDTVLDILSDIHRKNCSLCHDLNDFSKLVGSAAGREGAAPNSCITCHSSYSPDFNQAGAHQVKDHSGITTNPECTGCHSDADMINGTHDQYSVGGSYACDRCHTPLSGALIAGVTGDATNHRIGTPSDCTACHPAYGQDYTNHTSAPHTTLSMTPVCESCHTVNTPPFIGSSSHPGCDTCHTPGTGVLMGSAAGGPGTCVFCHAIVNTVDPHVDQHDYTRFDNTPALPCIDCHVENVAIEHNGRNGATGPITCYSCHVDTNDPNYFLFSSLIGWGKDKISVYCRECHSVTPNAVAGANGYRSTDHPNDVLPDHELRGFVGPTAACVTCHDSSNNKDMIADIHLNDCNLCHDPQGYGLIGSASGREGLINGCQDCHSAYFDGHSHDHNASVTLDISDISQTGNRSCSECHQDLTGDSSSLDSWNGILWEHDTDGIKDGIGACATCHNSSRDTSKSGNHSIGKTVQDVITDDISYPNPIHCAACHLDKITPNPESAHGHLTSDFVWDGNCAICHAPSGTTGVSIVNDIHKGSLTCMACHSTAKGGGTLIVGPSTFGIDGSAVGGTILSSCTSCHMVSEVTGANDAAKSGTIHHVSSNGYAAAGLCTNCHKADGDTTPTKLAADHSTTIILYSGANGCDPCHADFTGTGGPDDRTHGTTTGAIIDADYTIFDNTKVHDTCTTCHNVDGTVFPYITDPNDLMADGYDPRGKTSDCVDCHGSAIGPAHRYVDHTGKITTTVDCQWCHADQIGGPNGAAIDINDNMVHDDCTTCHEPDMSLHPYTPANPSPRNIVTAMDPTEGGTCNKCHVGRTFDEHRNIDHRLMVKAPVGATGSDNCVSCHDQTAAVYYGPYDFNNYPDPVSAVNGGGGVPVDLDPAVFDDPKLHDACYYCHQLTGQLKSPADVDPQIISDMPGWGDADLTNGGGECQACHGSYFTKHDHGDGPGASVRTNVSHAVSVGSDQSASQDCITCHAGQVENWNNILNIHGTCVRCHDSTRTINLKAGFTSVNDVIIQGGTTLPITCLDCHANTAVDHVTDHSLFVQTESLCAATCHSQSVLNGVHALNGCTTCHDATYPPVILKGSATGHETGPNTCTTCHSAYFNGHSHDHGTSEVLLASSTVPTENCDGCHTALTSPFIGTGEVHEAGCTLCHNSTDGGLTAPAVVNGGECAACHTSYFGGHLHGSGSLHYVSAGSDTSGGRNCVLCHTGQVENWSNILTSHTDCTICHDSPRATNVAPAFNSVADVILQGGAARPITCLDCHADKDIDHTPSHTFFVAANSDCTACHQASDLLLGIHPFGGTSTSGCTTCHPQATLPIGTLLGSATGHSGATALAPNTCDVCHFTGYGSHSSDTHAAMVLSTTDNSCERCHTATASPFVGATEPHNPAACDSCHSPTGALQGSAVNHTIGTPSNCGTCHLDRDPVDHVAEHDMTAFDTTPPLTCSNCHSSMSNINSGHMGLSSDMGTLDCNSCHAYSGSKLIKANIDAAITAGRSSATVPTTAYCSDCHGARAVDHPNDIMPPHTFLLKSLTSCESCHDQLGTLDVVTEIHKGNCLNCHDAAYTVLRQGVYGDATLHGAIGVGNTSDCLVCHPDHALNYTFHGADSHSSTIKTTVDNSCDSCHSVSIAPFSGVGEPHATGCSLCHNSNGTLKGSALNHSVGSPSDCQKCHFTGYNSHTSDTHNVNVTNTVNSCDTCHTATTSPFTTAGEPHAAGCNLCHNSSGALQGSAATHTLRSPSNCQDCHFSAYGSHSSDTHAAMVVNTTDNSCDSCHVATTSPFTAVGEPHAAGCTLCHDGNGTLQGSAAANHVIGVTSNCQGCHFSSYSAHTSNTHNLVATTTDNTCDSCHATSTPPFIGAGEPHALSCPLCHNPNGSLQGSAAGHTIGVTSTCQDCHFTATSYTSHSSDTHGANVLATSDNSCESCHITTTSPFTAQGEPHNSGCTLCHNSSGTLIGSASTNHTVRTPSDCQGCHFTSYTSHTSDTHANLQNTADNTCDSCHTATTAPFTGVGEPHEAGCSLCHNASGTLLGSALNHVIGTVSTCQDCHFTAASYTSHTSDSHPVMVIATADNSCESCHVATVSPFTNPGEAHQNGCNLCHNSSGTLIGSAGSHIIGTPSNCQECHFTSYNTHTSDSHALNVITTVDNSCETCHLAATSPFTNPGEVHETGCTLCHDPQGTLLGSAAANHTLGSPSNCQTCHFSLYTTHTSDSHIAMITATSDNSCDSCHVASTSPFTNTGEVHQAGCTVCHDSNGALTGSAASNHTIGIVSDCKGCHFTLYNLHLADTHAATTTATTDNSCDSCHIATSAPFTGIGEVHEAGCALCHNSNGSLKGSAAAHTIGTTSTCQDCHFTTYNGHTTDTHGATITATTDNSCDSCHIATTAPFVGAGEVHSSGCTLCHYSNGSLKGSAATNHSIGTVSDCQGCHFSSYTSHSADTHGVNVLSTTDNSCDRCHLTTVSPFSAIGEVHETGCTLCHNPNGSLIGSAAVKHTVGTPSDCQGCHFSLFSNHTSDTHSINVLTTTDNSCDSCHLATTSPFTNNGEPHVTGCSLCHSLDGTLIGSAGTNHTKGTPSTCKGCHFSGYNSHTSNTHTVNVTATTDNSCESCHVALASPFIGTGEVHEPGTIPGGPPFFIDTPEPCSVKCHNSSTGSLIGSAGSNHIVGSVSNCQVCHFATYTSHATDTHGTMVTDMADNSCNACHTATTAPFTNPGEAHEAGCTLCHTSNGSLQGSAVNHAIATASNCVGCHLGYFDGHTHLHAVNYNPATDVAQSDSSGCQDCHGTGSGPFSLANWSDILTEHDVPTNGSGPCTTCHNSTRKNSDDGGRVTIDPGKYLTSDPSVPDVISLGTTVECLDCHYNKKAAAIHQYLPHNTDNGLGYPPLVESPDCVGCHPVNGDTIVSGVHKNTCRLCHTTISTPVGLHTTPNLQQFAGASIACIDCHSVTNNNGFSMNYHGLSWNDTEITSRHDNLAGSDWSGVYRCDDCHILNTPQDRLMTHMVVDTPFNCLRCHAPSSYNAALSDLPATSVIASGQTSGGGISQACESCHTTKGAYNRHGLTDDNGPDGAADMHNNFLAESGTSTSACSTCHLATLAVNRIQLHTSTNGTGSGSCMTCHNGSIFDLDPGPGVVTTSDVIDAGKGTGGSPQYCDNCHIALGSDWYQHTPPDHSTAMVLPDAACTNCHDGNPGTNTTAPNTISSPYTGVTENHAVSGCATCHSSAGILTAKNGNYTTAMAQGSCTTCHTTYFDTHSHGTDPAIHDLSYNSANDKLTTGESCNSCHGVDGGDIGTTVLDNWDEILTLHGSSCSKCHNYDGTNGIYNTTPVTEVQTAISTGTGVECITCHIYKIYSHTP